MILSKDLVDISSVKITLGRISLDKDNPYECEIETNLKEFDFTNKVVILVDDVLNSGKTLMYAAKYFLTTPLSRLATVVLVDRTHRKTEHKRNQGAIQEAWLSWEKVPDKCCVWNVWHSTTCKHVALPDKS